MRRGVAIYAATVTALSLDYQAVLASLEHPLDPAAVGAALLSALGDRYALEHHESALHEFEQSRATYLFDLASFADLPQEDRTVAAWALTPAAVAKRASSYQRGFPLAPHADEAPVDRGHVIPHLSGGEFGPNIFRQDRALNRGWSQEGKRYRALERQAAATPGTFYIAPLMYDDDSAHPCELGPGSSAARHCTSSDTVTDPDATEPTDAGESLHPTSEPQPGIGGAACPWSARRESELRPDCCGYDRLQDCASARLFPKAGRKPLNPLPPLTLVVLFQIRIRQRSKLLAHRQFSCRSSSSASSRFSSS